MQTCDWLQQISWPLIGPLVIPGFTGGRYLADSQLSTDCTGILGHLKLLTVSLFRFGFQNINIRGFLITINVVTRRDRHPILPGVILLTWRIKNNGNIARSKGVKVD